MKTLKFARPPCQ